MVSRILLTTLEEAYGNFVGNAPKAMSTVSVATLLIPIVPLLASMPVWMLEVLTPSAATATLLLVTEPQAKSVKMGVAMATLPVTMPCLKLS